MPQKVLSSIPSAGVALGTNWCLKYCTPIITTTDSPSDDTLSAEVPTSAATGGDAGGGYGDATAGDGAGSGGCGNSGAGAGAHS